MATKYECDPCTDCSKKLISDELMWKRWLIDLLCRISKGSLSLFKNAQGTPTVGTRMASALHIDTSDSKIIPIAYILGGTQSDFYRCPMTR